jgi:hypothetical protein
VPVTVTTRLCRAVAPCLLAGVLGACRDLALPDVSADGGVGPDLTVRSPREGQTIPLNAAVNIDAVSVNGVASVTVTCGGAPSTGVFTWNVAPYTGVVDFTRCSLVTTGSADAGFGQLQLTFIAVDRLGHTSTRTFNVFLDTTTAALSAVLPERVVPLAPLQLTVGSDRPLLLPPTVRLAGREADGVFTSGEAPPAPGDWVGLWLDTAPGSQLDHVVIEYAGGVNGINSNNCKDPATQDQGGLLVGDFETQYVPPSNLLTNSTLRFNAGYGIVAMWQTTSANNTPDLTATDTFTSNALCAQSFNGTTTGCTSTGCTAP